MVWVLDMGMIGSNVLYLMFSWVNRLRLMLLLILTWLKLVVNGSVRFVLLRPGLSRPPLLNMAVDVLVLAWWVRLWPTC